MLNRNLAIKYLLYCQRTNLLLNKPSGQQAHCGAVHPIIHIFVQVLKQRVNSLRLTDTVSDKISTGKQTLHCLGSANTAWGLYWQTSKIGFVKRLSPNPGPVQQQHQPQGGVSLRRMDGSMRRQASQKQVQMILESS